MSLTIDQFYPNQYQTNVDLAIQQLESKLQGAVTREDFEGKRKAFNLLNSRAASLISARKQSTPNNDPSLEKYWLTQNSYQVTETLDEFDDFYLAQIVLPTSPMVQNFAASFNRTVDDVIIAAVDGVRLVGEDGTTSSQLSSFNGDSQRIAVDYVESGSAVSSGLTIGKLRQASYLLDAQNVPEDDRYIVVGPAQKRDLLRAGEIGDADYNTVRALVNAEINTFMGFTFLHSTRLGTSGGNRKVLVFHRTGVKFSLGQRKSYMDIRPDLSHALTVRSTMALGAVRTEDEKVVTIACAE
jgi:hypothetical protein